MLKVMLPQMKAHRLAAVLATGTEAFLNKLGTALTSISKLSVEGVVIDHVPQMMLKVEELDSEFQNMCTWAVRFGH